MLNLLFNLFIYFGSFVLLLCNAIINLSIKLHLLFNTKSGKRIKEYNKALKELKDQLEIKQDKEITIKQKDRYSRLADIIKGE
jgi:hypothetical protein